MTGVQTCALPIYLKNYYKDNLAPNISKLIIVGDVNKETILPKLGFLKNWTSERVIGRRWEFTPPAITKTKLYLVNKEKSAQSEIRIGYMALSYDPFGDYYKNIIVNYPLGGAFNSRINMNLREAKGWTYGARSGFVGGKYDGRFSAAAGVKLNATDSSIVEFMKEIKMYAAGGIKQEELDFSKKAILQSDALRFESPEQKAYFLKRLVDFSLDAEYIKKQNEILKAITKQDVDALAAKYLPYNNMDIVVVGDKAKIYEGLVKLGYEIVELDMNGNPVVK